MKASRSRGGRALAARARLFRTTALVALAVVPAAGGCGGSGPGAAAPTAADYLLAPEEVHYGLSYSGWSMRFWQWMYELPRTNHPVFDPTGAEAWRGQVDPVWFLCGILGSLFAPTDGTAVRDITVPNGTAFFVGPACVSWTNQECVDPDTTYSYTELRQFAYDAVQSVRDVRCEVNGVSLLDSPDLAGAARFRAQAQQFSYLVPADNVFVEICNDAATSVVHGPVASDGIWVMIAPLPPGQHTIHFEGTFPGNPVDFHQDITYHVTVLP
jgi:hypothetical protein